MSDNINNIQRRAFMKLGLGTAGAIVATRGVAFTCPDNATPEQTQGPFFPYAGTPANPVREDPDPATPIHLANDNDLTYVKGRSGTAKGQIIYIKGQVVNMDCEPIAGANLVIWQASESGRYNHTADDANANFRHPKTGALIKRRLDPHFQYWGRVLTDARGEYWFKTIVPGFYPADLRNGWYRPPHIHFLISATGYQQLVTQMYFRGPKLVDIDFIQELNDKDYLLQSSSISDEERDKLIIDFQDPPGNTIRDGLYGEFRIALRR